MIVMKSNIRHKKGKEERQCRNWKKNEIVAGKEDNAAVAMMKKKLNLSYLKRQMTMMMTFICQSQVYIPPLTPSSQNGAIAGLN